jgi:small basic protein
MSALINAILPLIQYPAMVCTIVGYYFVSSKLENVRKIGFVVGLAGNIVWFTYAFFPIQWGLLITNAFIFVFSVRGYLNNTGTVNENLMKVIKEENL